MAARWQWIKSFKTNFPGLKDILVGVLVGAGITKVYYETTNDSGKTENNSKRQIRQLVQKYDNLKFGERLRTIDIEDDETDSFAAGDSVSKYGLPRRSSEFIQYTNHVLCYDQAKKIPRWVAEHLTQDKISPPAPGSASVQADRGYSIFQPDLNIPSEFQSTNEDYLGRGWSRGHMAPAADSKFSQQAMNETFFLSNVVPQDFDNNSNFWYRLEVYCRSLAKRFGDVHVISGPLFLPTEESEGKVVKYKVIGDGNVAVPTHLFKVILTESDGKPPLLGAFIIPNQPIGFEYNLQDFQVPVEQLAKDSGLVFFPSFPKSTAEDLCAIDGCRLISKEFMEMIFFSRKLRNAETLEELEKEWKRAGEMGIKPDKISTETYEKRKKELRSENAIGNKMFDETDNKIGNVDNATKNDTA